MSGETYLIGRRQEHSNLEVVEAICDLRDERLPAGACRCGLIHFAADRPGHYAIDASQAEAELGCRLRETLAIGIAKSVDRCIANSGW